MLVSLSIRSYTLRMVCLRVGQKQRDHAVLLQTRGLEWNSFLAADQKSSSKFYWALVCCTTMLVASFHFPDEVRPEIEAIPSHRV